MSEPTLPPGATYDAPPQLTEQSPYSYRLIRGKPAALAAWLHARGFDRTSVKVAGSECYRLERPSPRRERAIVIIFASGSILVQGHPQPRDEALALLCELVIEVEPAGAQLELFGGVR
jgi:hypothetical protein